MKKLIFLFLFFLSVSSLIEAQNKQITLEEIYRRGTFYPEFSKSMRSMKDGEHYTVLENSSDIVKYKYSTGEKADVILEIGKIKPALASAIQDYEFNEDETKVLLMTEMEPIYRHSFKASYYVYDLVNKVFRSLTDEGKQQLASFSPKGTEVAFVRDNNIYIKYLNSGRESRVTINGEFNKIINGAPDWVYEEEFGFSKAFSWSPEGKYLAYYKFDETKVRQYSMPIYDSLYPEHYTYKYPKAGEANSVVSIHVYNTETKGTTIMNTGIEEDQYIPRIKWTKDPNTLCILRMNRLQNKLEILLTDALSGISNPVYTENNEKYIEITDNLYFLDDNKSFLITSEGLGYNHIFQYGLDGKLIGQVTKGNWDVTKLIGYDEKSKVVLYESAEVSPLERHVYSIDLKGKSKVKLTSRPGTNSADFSATFKYFINENTSANTPLYISVIDKSGKEVRVLQKNEDLASRLKDFGFAKVEFLKVKAGKEELNAWMIKPGDFDPAKKYPVFMYVYGGPGSQTVTDEWSYNLPWFELLAQKGYIVASVDNRGTGARGEDFRKVTYMELGKYETEDQINAAKYFGNLPYVDKNRIGIFGWSYGGYMTSLCLTKGADVFKMGIAVAPVTNWRYYDNIYTERYMRTPQENASGYDDNSPIHFVSELKGKFLLVHGTADDNVHFQNSMEFVSELVKANKQFDAFFYPNSNHGMNGRNARYHLYTKMTNFILENL